MNISFWGSPKISAELFKSLLADRRFNVLYAVTQPDKPRSQRGRQIIPSAVKQIAEQIPQELNQNKIPVFTPEKLSDVSFLKNIQSFQAELHVVFAYGKIIPENIFNQPNLGSVNFHASLLPELRGAAPIEFALWQGKTKTGWSLQKINDKLDTGCIIEQVKCSITWEDNQESLYDKMQRLLLNHAGDMLERFQKGESKPFDQNESKATYCRKIISNDRKLDWSLNTVAIRNIGRALSNRPGVFSYFDKKPVKIFFDFTTSLEEIQKRKYLSYRPGKIIIEDQHLKSQSESAKKSSKNKELWVYAAIAMPLK